MAYADNLSRNPFPRSNVTSALESPTIIRRNLTPDVRNV